MKKFLACTLALTMTAAMLASCGDTDSSSSEAATTTTTTAAEESSAAEATSDAASEAETTDSAAADSTAADSTADSATDSASDSASDSSEAEGDQPRDISEVGDDLKNYDTASIKFSADTDVNSFAEMFNEEVDGHYPGEEDYEGDEAVLELSVEEVGGINMMKVNCVPDAKGKYQNIKLRFDMNKLFEGSESDMDKIFSVKADLVFVAQDEWESDDGELSLVPGWYGGAFGTNNNGTWNGNMIEINDGEYTSTWRVTETTIRPGVYGGDAVFSANNESNYLTLMEWGITHDLDMYIADITFLDEDGNVISVPGFDS